jgi:hypothetical protein
VTGRISGATPVTGGEVRDMWFLHGGSFWWGPGDITDYLASEVDALLGRVAAELDAGRPAGPLIENAMFRSAAGKYAYQIDAVDWFLDRLLLSQDHGEPAATSADAWRDGNVTQLVRGGVSGLAHRYPPPQKPPPRKAGSGSPDSAKTRGATSGSSPVSSSGGSRYRTQQTGGSCAPRGS